MPKYLSWIEKGNVSAERVLPLFAILVRQAGLQQPMTYGEVADELGVHHRGIDKIAWYLGLTLDALGKTRDWRSCPPPQLQALIVNKTTRIPGDGIDGFMSDSWKKAKTIDRKRAILKAVFVELAQYKYWIDVADAIGADGAPADLSDLVDAATNAKKRGGEGPEHKALKEHIAANPVLVGLSAGHPAGRTERPLASGDRVDVVFRHKRKVLAVEVKPAGASDGDMARGVFQCIKYRHVLEAQSGLAKKPYAVDTVLVIGKLAPAKIKVLAASLGVTIVDTIRAPSVD